MPANIDAAREIRKGWIERDADARVSVPRGADDGPFPVASLEPKFPRCSPEFPYGIRPVEAPGVLSRALPLTDLDRALGPAAAAVWKVLVGLRDTHGPGSHACSTCPRRP